MNTITVKLNKSGIANYISNMGCGNYAEILDKSLHVILIPSVIFTPCQYYLRFTFSNHSSSLLPYISIGTDKGENLPHSMTRRYDIKVFDIILDNDNQIITLHLGVTL